MPRMRYTADCPRMVADMDYPAGPLVACEGSVESEGTEDRGGWYDAPHSERTSEWGPCDQCGASDWTDAEVDRMDRTCRETDMDREGWDDHREEHGR
jgi:hypothetical protein